MGRKRRHTKRSNKRVTIGKRGFGADAPGGEKRVKMSGGFIDDAPHSKRKVPKVEGIKLS